MQQRRSEFPQNMELSRHLKENAVEFSRFEGNLISAGNGQLPKSLLITSCSSGEGKTTSTAAIGISLAERGTNSILLVDAHFREPRLHKLLGQANSPGLAEVVLNEKSWQEAIQSCKGLNLHFLPTGEFLDHPLSIFHSPRFSSMLEELKEHFDCIIFDGPPFLSASECAYIAPMIQGILMVISCEHTRWELLSIAKTKIESVQGELMGVIMNHRKYYIPQSLYKIL